MNRAAYIDYIAPGYCPFLGLIAIDPLLEGLRKKLRILVDANYHCPELEQMGRKEFCVDMEELHQSWA